MDRESIQLMLFVLAFLTPWIIGEIVERRMKSKTFYRIQSDWREYHNGDFNKIKQLEARVNHEISGLGSSVGAGCAIVFFLGLNIYWIINNLILN